jgi:hypothetical protein
MAAGREVIREYSPQPLFYWRRHSILNLCGKIGHFSRFCRDMRSKTPEMLKKAAMKHTFFKIFCEKY